MEISPPTTDSIILPLTLDSAPQPANSAKTNSTKANGRWTRTENQTSV